MAYTHIRIWSCICTHIEFQFLITWFVVVDFVFAQMPNPSYITNRVQSVVYEFVLFDFTLSWNTQRAHMPRPDHVTNCAFEFAFEFAFVWNTQFRVCTLNLVSHSFNPVFHTQIHLNMWLCLTSIKTPNKTRTSNILFYPWIYNYKTCDYKFCIYLKVSNTLIRVWICSWNIQTFNHWL